MSDHKTDDKTDDKGEDRYTVPALARGLQLLMSFNRDERELTGAELSRRLDLPRASVFRMLQTLEQGGFVERVGDGASYKLGLSVLRLGFEYLASMELTEHGRPVIEDLRDLCGYSAHVVVRDNRDVVFVAKAAGRSAMFHSIQVGARLPAHATVLGRVLLGDLSLAELRELYPEEHLEQHSPSTPSTVMALFDMVQADRQRGFVSGEGFFEPSISTVAAPVRDQSGSTFAALGVTIPTIQVGHINYNELLLQVRRSADELSRLLNYNSAAHDGQPRVTALMRD